MTINSDLKDTYDNLVKELKKLKGSALEHREAFIHVRSKGVFLGIHPRKDHLILQIVSDHPLKSARIIKVDQVSKSRFHNHVWVSSSEQINAELLGWLKEAHKLMP